MQTSEYTREQSDIRSVLDDLKTELVENFPDLALCEVMMDRIVIFGKSFAATVYAINAPRDEFDIVVKTEDLEGREPREENDLSTDDVVMMLQPLYDKDYSQEITSDDVDEIMTQLMQHNPRMKTDYKHMLKESLTSGTPQASMLNEGFARMRLLAGMVKTTPVVTFSPSAALPKIVKSTNRPATLMEKKLFKAIKESLPPGFNLKGGKYSHILKHLKQEYGYNNPRVFKTAWFLYNNVLNEMGLTSEDANLLHNQNLNEYLPPKFKENHPSLLKKIQREYPEDKLTQIRTAWKVYSELPSANAKLQSPVKEGELIPNPPCLNNGFKGRYAQLAGAINGFDGSDFNELEEDNIAETRPDRDQRGRKKWSRSETEDPMGNLENNRVARGHTNKRSEGHSASVASHQGEERRLPRLTENVIVDPNVVINAIQSIIHNQ